MASKRKISLAARRAQKKASILRPGAKSNYARKAAYLRNNGGWGWEYAEPKPWK